MDAVKVGKGVAAAGLLMIAIAGGLSAKDRLQGGRTGTCTLPPQMQATSSEVPTILDVRSGSEKGKAVIKLGEPVCLSVAAIRSPAELKVLRDARDSSERELAANPQSAAHAARVTEAKKALTAATQNVELALYLNDRETPARAVAAGSAEPQALMFELEPTSDASSEEAGRWRKLLSGIPSGGKRTVVVGIAPPGAARPLAKWPHSESVGQVAELKVFTPRSAWIAGLGFLLLLAAIFIAGTKSTLLRDGGPDTAYSLGRTQMAFWMIATVFGFVFIWVLTGQYRNVITAASFTLLGISGATALAARAIEGNAAPSATKGFFVDILSDGTGDMKLHRIQVALWTLVLGTIFLWKILDQLVLTDFDTNLLILVGIANGVYAGFKTQEP